MGLKVNRELTGDDDNAPGWTGLRNIMLQNASKMLRRPDAANLILGVVIGLGVCAPLMGGGRLFLLDWSIGPHYGVVTPAALVSTVVSPQVSADLFSWRFSIASWAVFRRGCQ